MRKRRRLPPLHWASSSLGLLWQADLLVSIRLWHKLAIGLCWLGGKGSCVVSLFSLEPMKEGICPQTEEELGPGCLQRTKKQDLSFHCWSRAAKRTKPVGAGIGCSYVLRLTFRDGGTDPVRESTEALCCYETTQLVSFGRRGCTVEKNDSSTQKCAPTSCRAGSQAGDEPRCQSFICFKAGERGRFDYEPFYTVVVVLLLLQEYFTQHKCSFGAFFLEGCCLLAWLTFPVEPD